MPMYRVGLLLTRSISQSLGGLLLSRIWSYIRFQDLSAPFRTRANIQQSVRLTAISDNQLLIELCSMPQFQYRIFIHILLHSIPLRLIAAPTLIDAMSRCGLINVQQKNNRSLTFHIQRLCFSAKPLSAFVPRVYPKHKLVSFCASPTEMRSQ